jgi:hypothetical protein
LIATFLAQNATWLLPIGVLLLGISIWNAARAARLARRGAYYVVREEALRKTRRWAFAATLVAVIGVALTVVAVNRPVTPVAIVTIAPTPTAAPIISPTKIQPSATPTETLTKGPTVTASPKATSTASATPVPANKIPSLLLTPVPLAVSPAPGAKLTLITLASLLDSSKNPVDPGQIFPAGTKTIQVLFKASGVNNNVVYSIFCLKDAKIVDSIIDLWRWNTQPQSSRIFCSIDGSVGAYKVEAYLGLTKQFEVTFDVIAPTPTSPPTPSPTSSH